LTASSSRRSWVSSPPAVRVVLGAGIDDAVQRNAVPRQALIGRLRRNGLRSGLSVGKTRERQSRSRHVS
jgi:hypothetical protein